mgnify:CR=1 FL=1
MKKIYFVNGFLEAGKTTFIKELLSQDDFDSRCNGICDQI